MAYFGCRQTGSGGLALALALSGGFGLAFNLLSDMLLRMNARIDLLLEDVLRLSAAERSAVAAALIDSLEASDESSVSGAWRAELLRRREDLRAGVVQSAPWSEVRARMSAM